MSELKLRWEAVKSHWQQIVFPLGLAAALAALTSCGSKPTSTTTPTITVSCNPTDVTVLNTSQCTATVLNLSSTLVNWSVAVTNGGTGSAGTISGAGLYTAPAAVPSNTVTITATSQVQSTLTATQAVTIVGATQITTVTCVDPSTNSSSVVESEKEMDCTATASTGATVAVNWTVANKNAQLGGNVGSISAQGIYTAPLVPPPGQMVTITATSQEVSTITMGVTVKVVFGNAVLNGNYVFSTSGKLHSGAFWARTGSFSAGGGTLVGGIEDTNQGGSPNIVNNNNSSAVPPPPRSFTGSYSVGPDGRGTMQFCEDTSTPCPQGSPASAYFQIVVSPNRIPQIQMIEFSAPPTGSTTTGSTTTIASGEMILQDPSVLSPTAGTLPLAGVYSFSVPGVSSAGSEESVIGEFKASGFSTNGTGGISGGNSSTPGELDVNNGASNTQSTLNPSTYTYSSNGRGTLKLSFGTPAQTLTFSFYMASGSRAKLIEIDSPASIFIGDAYLQQGSASCGWAVNALNGATVLETSGTSGGVAVADVGSFTPSNNGTTGTVNVGWSIDQNSGGAVSSVVGTATGTYALDACGRGQLSIGTHSYVFYIFSPSNAVLQEITAGTVANGLLVPSQGGTFADGSYAFRMEGTDAAGSTGASEDFLGQFNSVTSSGSTKLNGTLDLNDFGTTQSGLTITNGAFTAGTGLRSTLTFPLNTSPATTRNLVIYTVSPTLFYALDIDGTPAGTAIGVIENQF